MRHALAFALALFAGSALADETRHYCHDPDVIRQWQEAQKRYPRDALVLRLAAQRETLCGLLAYGKIARDAAQAQWQAALTDALLARAHKEQRQRSLLRLFATF